MDNKAKLETGKGSYYNTWGRNGQPVKVYVPSKEEAE